MTKEQYQTAAAEYPTLLPSWDNLDPWFFVTRLERMTVEELIARRAALVFVDESGKPMNKGGEFKPSNTQNGYMGNFILIQPRLE